MQKQTAIHKVSLVIDDDLELFVIDDGSGLLECQISGECYSQFLNEEVDNSVFYRK